MAEEKRTLWGDIMDLLDEYGVEPRDLVFLAADLTHLAVDMLIDEAQEQEEHLH